MEGEDGGEGMMQLHLLSGPLNNIQEMPEALRSGALHPWDVLTDPRRLPASLVESLIFAELWRRAHDGWERGRSVNMVRNASSFRELVGRTYEGGEFSLNEATAYWLRRGESEEGAWWGYKISGLNGSSFRMYIGWVMGLRIRSRWLFVVDRWSRRTVETERWATWLADAIEIWSACGERTPLLLANGELPVPIPEMFR